MWTEQNSTTCLFTPFCIEKYISWNHGKLYRTYFSYLSLSIRADWGLLCTVTIIRSGPCLSIYNISLSVHSITRYHVSLKLFAVAPPRHRNTLQHYSPLLKIDPCEVTHSGKHSARETNNAAKNKRKNAHQHEGTAAEYPADFISLSAPLWQIDVQRFFNDIVRFWGQMINSARPVSRVVSAQSSPDCRCDKSHSGYKYPRWSWWIYRSVILQPRPTWQSSDMMSPSPQWALRVTVPPTG